MCATVQTVCTLTGKGRGVGRQEEGQCSALHAGEMLQQQPEDRLERGSKSFLLMLSKSMAETTEMVIERITPTEISRRKICRD